MITGDDVRAAPTVREYVNVVWRRKWFFLIPALLVPAVAVLLATREPTVYQASARYLLNKESAVEIFPGAATPYVDATTALRIAQTQAELARTPELASRAVAAARAGDVTPHELLENSTVTGSSNADFVLFAVNHPDPETAARLATAYARAFASYRYELHTRALENARESTAEQMAAMEKAGLAESDVYKRLAETQAQIAAAEALRGPVEDEVVQPAQPATAVPPPTRRNGILGAALGVVLGLGLAFLFESLDTRTRSVDHVRRRLPLPLLARLPAPSRRNREGDDLVMATAPRSKEAETFRVLRARIESMAEEASARTIMVTSAVAGEGTSTIVANLGVAFARTGKRVILVDLDLRSPSLHKFFGLDETPGLLDLKRGRRSLDESLRLVSVGGDNGAPSGALQPAVRPEANLEVLPIGKPLKDPDEFGPGLPIEVIVGRLRDRADIVLIDAPALSCAGEPILLSAHVDALLAVVRLNSSRAGDVDELRRTLSSSPAARIGVVVTGAEKRRGSRRRRSQPTMVHEPREPVIVQPSSRASLGSHPAPTGEGRGLTARGSRTE